MPCRHLNGIRYLHPQCDKSISSERFKLDNNIKRIDYRFGIITDMDEPHDRLTIYYKTEEERKADETKFTEINIDTMSDDEDAPVCQVFACYQDAFYFRVDKQYSNYCINHICIHRSCKNERARTYNYCEEHCKDKEHKVNPDKVEISDSDSEDSKCQCGVEETCKVCSPDFITNDDNKFTVANCNNKRERGDSICLEHYIAKSDSDSEDNKPLAEIKSALSNDDGIIIPCYMGKRKRKSNKNQWEEFRQYEDNEYHAKSENHKYPTRNNTHYTTYLGVTNVIV